MSTAAKKKIETKADDVSAAETIKVPPMKITRMNLKVRGITSLITHAWSEKAKKQMRDKQTKQGRTAKEAKDPVADFEAAKYKINGKDCVPSLAFKNAIVSAARFSDGLKMTVLRGGLLRYLGLTPAAPRPAPPEPPLAQRLGRARRALREAVIVYLGLCAVIQAINENKSVPAFLKHDKHVPWFVRATIVYPRIFQGWGMFSANPITDDGVLAVDAITVDGRHVDPFTGEPPDLDLTDARGAGLDQITQDYFNRIRLDRNKAYRKPQGLQEYLLRYHERTGRPEDEVVAFDVFWVRDQCPRPGETKPYDNETIPILSYRRAGYRPRPGLPPLPPPLTERSAGE